MRPTWRRCLPRTFPCPMRSLPRRWIRRPAAGCPSAASSPAMSISTSAPLASASTSMAFRSSCRYQPVWNGRFMFQGGGGTEGSTPNATRQHQPQSDIRNRQRYAVASQNGGHFNSDLAAADLRYGIRKRERVLSRSARHHRSSLPIQSRSPRWSRSTSSISSMAMAPTIPTGSAARPVGARAWSCHELPRVL